jgi:hypothetical protein
MKGASTGLLSNFSGMHDIRVSSEGYKLKEGGMMTDYWQAN